MCYPYETIREPQEMYGPISGAITAYDMMCFLQTRHPSNKESAKKLLFAIILDIINFCFGIFIFIIISPIYIILFIIFGIPVIAIFLICVILFIVINIITLGVPICIIIYYLYDNHVNNIINAENATDASFPTTSVEIRSIEPIYL